MNLHRLAFGPKWLVTGIAISAITVATFGVLTVAGVIGPNADETGVGGTSITARDGDAPDTPGPTDGDDVGDPASTEPASDPRQPEDSSTSPTVTPTPASGTSGGPQPGDNNSGGGGPGSAPGGGGPGGGGPGGGGPGGGNGQPPDRGTKTFAISGSAQGLYPGGTAPLALQLENPSAFPIRVVSLTVQAANSDKAGCSANNLVVPSYEDAAGSGDDVVVPRRGTRTHTLQVGLVATAPDACQNATWSLSYSGRAVRA